MLLQIGPVQYCFGHGHWFVGWSDIGYSFVIGEDGNVYEGRGWDTVGAHTLHHNTDGLGKKWNDVEGMCGGGMIGTHPTL